ncbi:AAR040Cp [Eremothecium gossypii ATCC 10895]|uniref:Vacuolar fusion protein CCZ1 n=1 Tax=Eremothecium gossypii (strain ATCC 10895 / CBS 109.51 / FGSC 9923 / NRRL Y-1056) TaxID=284811 RepID=CCZ1_EREGS|nr:AAR040Cp [Eremothecium gossypii ATCC 10895]Q75EN9.1 RecName: Full=Vacuolar fusion protein CCZ1 [Eremothecium gossypii ATCC 10895]AAS50405.1 AAR040Cp [Eremothecium gossypii ATCC 10895]AEY94691.1 FAAR040Cp [Eremothecium gossypii FDAG1]
MDFIAVYNPAVYAKEADSEAWRQLLLYHSFKEDAEEPTPQNEKLSLIGMIQGIWQFAHNFSEPETRGSVRYVDTQLERRRVIAVEVEDGHFMAFGVEDGKRYGCEYYVRELLQSYHVFRLHCGSMSEFADRGELTDRLNEHVVGYWQALKLVPEAIYASTLASVCWHDGYKVSELELRDRAWESYIKNEILLDSESFLGLKDMCIYKLPRDGRRSAAEYGLLRSFAPEFLSLPELSNWVYHLDRLFETALSSHVLAGHVRLSIGGDEQEEEGELRHDSQPASDVGARMWRNVTMPISMTYDTMSEVGNLTGINTLMSGLNSLTSGFSSMTSRLVRRADRQNSDTASLSLHVDHGFLISPLALEALPESYRYRRFQLRFSTDEPQWYRLLFWYYKDYLCIFIFHENFDKIWDPDYLQAIDAKLYDAMLQLEGSVVTEDNKPGRFAYGVFNKTTKRIECSLPLLRFSDKRSDEKSRQPLKMVVAGIDETLQFLTAGTFATNMATSRTNDEHMGPSATNTLRMPEPTDAPSSSWTLDITKLNLFQGLNENLRLEKMADTDSGTFLDSLSSEKLLQLNVELCRLYTGIRRSEYNKAGIQEEQLLRLNNGILFYISTSPTEDVLILKNWFMDDKYTKAENKRSTSASLLHSLGGDVRRWWNARTNREQ